MSARQTLRTPDQLGLVLQAARKARKLSQTALAARVGLSQSRVSQLEQHAGALSVDQLLAWTAALDLEITVGSRDEVADRRHVAEW
ncbi:MAG TPA: helix-turn-helix transcriptional regulator [Dokdonella sp.]|uniref:helix-turn-helix domain-containing protein n=1 Tax=Dokdonella sp. TaxID=2291710 RepID=UPI002C1DE31D|nr:helix-turn-helix transcriptional regulator [Dokdonella sp.]HUD43597.1 helix-turn-helix transcriptional regulator [Dokdonella sp.]